jgi:NTE family protein
MSERLAVDNLQTTTYLTAVRFSNKTIYQFNHFTMSRSLVISGGGSKGAFAVGVIKRLLREFPNLSFDTYVGTSTGSLIAPLAAMGEFALLEKLYTSITNDDVIETGNLGDRLSENSIFGGGPLWDLIEKFYNDDNYNKLLASGKKIYLTTVCLQTSELVV